MHHKRPKGFSLVELLTVVAIVGVLAAVAYPSYQNNARKTKLEDGKGALSELAKAIQRRYTQRIPNTYAGNATGGADTGTPDGSLLPPASTRVTFNFNIDAATATSFTVSATAVAGANIDPACTTITYTNAGVGSPAACW